jgi:hypothetical protein
LSAEIPVELRSLHIADAALFGGLQDDEIGGGLTPFLQQNELTSLREEEDELRNIITGPSENERYVP